MKPTKIYVKDLDSNTSEQFSSAMSQSFVVSGALMPDAHLGYSIPIGAVVATNDVIVPSWVGYDIGCGVCALKLPNITKKRLEGHHKNIFNKIYKRIPVGRNINTSETQYNISGLTEIGKTIVENKKYSYALGSLGSGNHFIEIGYDEEEKVWIVIHSGSRGVGHGIATHYMTVASCNPKFFGKEFDDNNTKLLKYNPGRYNELKMRYINKRMLKAKPKVGHYGLNEYSKNGKDYIQDLNWCLEYAKVNRLIMMSRVVSIIGFEFGFAIEENYAALKDHVINRNHNHVLKSLTGLWIHRKGATHAEKNMLGVIPGNMKDGSFIVVGKGNKDSLYSSSHGAGRIMSRNKAKENINIKDFKNSMKNITALVDDSTLDESPNVYKNIYSVMDQQSDLVDIVAHIKPLINVKG